MSDLDEDFAVDTDDVETPYQFLIGNVRPSDEAMEICYHEDVSIPHR